MTPEATEWNGSSLRISFNLQSIFLFVTASLASTILLKVGVIQYLEVIYFLLTGVLLLWFVQAGYKFYLPRILCRIALAYSLFSMAAVLLSLVAYGNGFYLPEHFSSLKGPIVITLSRVVELFASVVAMLYLADVFRRDVNRARFTFRIYFWTGFASGVSSLLSIPLDRVGIHTLGAYSEIHRVRGFYNEGGPYGLYVLSVLLVGFALYKVEWEPPRRIWLALMLMSVVFVFTFSKAAIAALLLLFVLNALFAPSILQRVTVVGCGLLLMVTFSRVIDVAGYLRSYKASASAYERASHLHAKDPNIVYGRIAGAFIVPKMIAAHPLAGVGWGNYGLVRNDPIYRGAAVFVDDADDPGLGLLGLTAEIGLPLLAVLLIILFLPFFILRRAHAPSWLRNLALVQPLVHICGAQLNLTYPWIVSAFALGLGLSLAKVDGAVPRLHEEGPRST